MSAPDKMIKKATVKDLNIELKILFEKIKKLEEKVLEKDMKLNEMEITIKGNKENIVKLEKILEKKENKKVIESFKMICRDCGKRYPYKRDLTEHMKKCHPREYNCKICEKTFCDSLKLEIHSKTHEEIVPFNCNICDKDFYSKWRLKKHISSHLKKSKFCHFFNNDKNCPFEEVGCKFKHEVANKCRYDQNCKIKLCQFQHSPFENQEDKNYKETGTADKYKKYNEMNEEEHFDVKEEICVNICWGGDHKCFDHNEDNELLGVDVEKLRDDYDNGRKEKFNCEKCEYFSTKMDEVKKHFMTHQENTYYVGNAKKD